MKSKFIRIVNLIVAVAVFVFAIGYVFAWLAESRREAEQKFNGSSGQTYFASGNGLSKETAFIINNKYHLYNLAWLQNTGKLDKKYYFALGDNVDINDNDFWLPPIGTNSNPFKGDFDGKGYKISGLKITTDTSELIGVPSSFSGDSTADTSKFSNAVGVFGMTGADGSAEIHNYILDNLIVEVATQNAPYFSLETADKNVAGLAIGYLNAGCKAYSIGVLAPQGTVGAGAKLDLQRQNCNHSTFNSIIGALAKDSSSSVTGGGHISGDNVGFGGTLNFLRIMRCMQLIHDTNETNNTKWATPKFVEFNGLSSGRSTHLAQNSYLPLEVSNTVDIDNDSFYSSNNSETVARNNIGYIVGVETKIKSRKKSTFTDTNNVYTAKYENGNISRVIKTDLDEDIKAVLYNELLQQEYLYGVRFNKQIEASNWMQIKNANLIGNENITITVPPHTVWFAAQETGLAKFIFSAESSTLERGVSLYRIVRSELSEAQQSALTDDQKNPYYTPLDNRQ